MANMFRCTLASGGALILTVTSDGALAGQTITCTDGTTTLTQICPSTSPYTVEFKIPNGGTWTISSGTASTSVVIPDSIELHEIPNGSTITPINNIQIWLHCANIWDKSYTTITQVLNDASTLQTLIASNNAADYMARSTTWASNVTANSSAMTYIGLNDYCANALLANSTWLNSICNSTYFESVLNVKIPTMTSNTTPSGVASSSSNYSTNYAYRAFDNDNSSRWASQANAPQHIAYKFTSNVRIYKANILPFYGGGGTVKNYKIEAKVNGTWSSQKSGVANNSEYSAPITEIIPNPQASNEHRLYIVDAYENSFSYVSIYSLQFYGRASS